MVSTICTPHFIPLWAYIVLFSFTYLNIMPVPYKIIICCIVVCFTILMPLLSIFIYRRFHKLSAEQANEKKRWRLPLILTIIPYLFCLILMQRMGMPSYMNGIILTGITCLVIALILTLKWKPSIHAMGMGTATGALIAFSSLFAYNPVWWLCAIILLSGIVCSAQLSLKQHTLSEVASNYSIGLIISILILHPVSNMLIFGLFFI